MQGVASEIRLHLPEQFNVTQEVSGAMVADGTQNRANWKVLMIEQFSTRAGLR
jgi:hypothetical protein